MNRFRLKNKDKNRVDNIDWNKLTNWLFIAFPCGMWWWSIFANGLFTTMVWTIVIIAMGGIVKIVKENR